MDYEREFPGEIHIPGRWPKHLAQHVAKNYGLEPEVMQEAGHVHRFRREKIKQYQQMCLDSLKIRSSDAQNFEKKLAFLKEESKRRREAGKRKRRQPGYWKEKRRRAKLRANGVQGEQI